VLGLCILPEGDLQGHYGQAYFEKALRVIEIVKTRLRITRVDNLLSALALITIYMLLTELQTSQTYCRPLLQASNQYNSIAKPF